MKRKDMIRVCLMDACQGDPHPLMGLMDYLLVDLHLSPDRIVAIAKRQFDLPTEAAWGAFYDLHPQVLQ